MKLYHVSVSHLLPVKTAFVHGATLLIFKHPEIYREVKYIF